MPPPTRCSETPLDRSSSTRRRRGKQPRAAMPRAKRNRVAFGNAITRSGPAQPVRFLEKASWHGLSCAGFFPPQRKSSSMIESDAFVQAMQDMGVNFFTGVPDSILGGIIAEL